VAASKLMDTADDFARLVARVVLVGVPLAGTMRSTDALMFGHRDLGDDQVLPIRAASRTWPAVHQMLPAWDAVVELDGTALPRARQLTEADGWPGEVGKDGGIIEEMLVRAREFQALVRNPLDRMVPGVAVLSIMGRKQDTGVHVQWDGTWFRRPFLYEAGDTLVPAQQTLDHAGSQFGDTVVLIAGAVRAQLRVGETVGWGAEVLAAGPERRPHLWPGFESFGSRPCRPSEE
jgi:hypothetical protein